MVGDRDPCDRRTIQGRGPDQAEDRHGRDDRATVPQIRGSHRGHASCVRRRLEHLVVSAIGITDGVRIHDLETGHAWTDVDPGDCAVSRAAASIVERVGESMWMTHGPAPRFVDGGALCDGCHGLIVVSSPEGPPRRFRRGWSASHSGVGPRVRPGLRSCPDAARPIPERWHMGRNAAWPKLEIVAGETSRERRGTAAGLSGSHTVWKRRHPVGAHAVRHGHAARRSGLAWRPCGVRVAGHCHVRSAERSRSPHLSDRWLAEDATHAAVLSVWRNLPRLRDPGTASRHGPIDCSSTRATARPAGATDGCRTRGNVPADVPL